ncbi:MAG: cytochrome c [Nitrosomonadales bacterium]|nr:cytochrome c [Nitrosomonadales bacterium]
MSKQLALVALLAGTTLATLPVQAAEPMEFQKVMKELGRNMQVVADAISREDWELVAKTAPLIAQHPQPPAEEKQRIVSFMGARMPKFKSFDMQTHEAAHELEHAAHEKNGQGVIDAFHKVQTSCLGCHQAFRAPFVKHFYGKAGE